MSATTFAIGVVTLIWVVLIYRILPTARPASPLKRSGLSMEVGRTDIQIGILLSAIVVPVLSVWIAARQLDNNSAKYILYALPPLILLVFSLVQRGRIAVNGSGIYAFLTYMFVATLAVLYSQSFDWFTVRDLLIISSYLTVFMVIFRAPRFVADALLAWCLIGTVTVALVQGVSLDFGIFNPQGKQLLESGVAFPAGILFLYYVSERQWGRGLIALVLFVLAFKRIAFLGVGAVLCIEMGLYICFRRPVGRIIASIIVMTISVLALFSIQIFDLMAILQNEANTSTNSVSLGRYNIAVELWWRIGAAQFGHILMGFGPGAADRFLFDSTNLLLSNPHNDWLKILFDYGAIGFVGLHVVLRLIHPYTPLGNKLYIYTAILMSTDNPIIYTNYFVCLFLITWISSRRPAGRSQA